LLSEELVQIREAVYVCDGHGVRRGWVQNLEEGTSDLCPQAKETGQSILYQYQLAHLDCFQNFYELSLKWTMASKGPRIPERVIDGPSQRLYILSLALVFQVCIKCIIFVGDA
jgi:hypothetical protein